MAVRNCARSEQEFIYLINLALDEIFDLCAAIKYDEEYMSDAAKEVEPLNQGMQA